jgi:hypothetical protein
MRWPNGTQAHSAAEVGGFRRPLHDSICSDDWSLSGGLAPIDDDGLTSKKRRFAGKEKDGVGDFLRRCRALDRHALEKIRLTLTAARKSVEHLGLDRPGRNGIDADAFAAPSSAAALVKPSTACLLAV